MRRAAATGLLAATLLSCGVLFALPSLLVPGIALMALAMASAAWVWAGAHRARLSLVTAAARVQEDEPVRLAASARLRPWSPPAELAGPSLGGAAGGERGRLELRSTTRFARRGRRELGPARLTIRDPLGLATRVAAEASAGVLVLPRIEPVRAGREAGVEGTGRFAARRAGPELEFDSLRPHRPGAPASRIHWPTAARAGELMERRLDPESDSRPLVVLDPSAPASEEALDRAVRAAASLCRALASAGGCRMLLPGDRRPASVEDDLRAWPALHGRLALVEAGGPPPRLPRSASASAVFWVTAARRAGPRALARATAAERYVVSPGDAPAGAAFSVAGCAGVRMKRVRARAA